MMTETWNCFDACGHFSCRIICLGILTESSARLMRIRHNGRWLLRAIGPGGSLSILTDVEINVLTLLQCSVGVDCVATSVAS